MNVVISPADLAVFLCMALFVVQLVMVYFYLTVVKKKSDAVISTNRALSTSVSDLVSTLQKVLQTRSINDAVAQARADDDREFIID